MRERERGTEWLKRGECLQRRERKNDCGDGRLNEKEVLGFRCLDLNKTQNDVVYHADRKSVV